MNRLAAVEPESATPVRFTVEQFLRMIDMGLFPDEHVELVHGEIIQLSPAHSRHGNMVARVMQQLLASVPVEQLVIDGFLRLDDESLRAFDITVLKPGVTPGDVMEPREVLLGIEIAESSIHRDLGEKMRHYASARIERYLVVDLKASRVLLMSGPDGDTYGERIEKRFGERLDLPDIGSVRLA